MYEFNVCTTGEKIMSSIHRLPRFIPLLVCLLGWLPLVQAATDCTTPAQTNIPQAECEALVALYTSTTGASWSDSPGNNWNVTNTPCSWTGITCADTTFPTNVIEIDRNTQNLVDTIPTELGNLTNLLYLYLDQNQLTGTIPTELGNLTNLFNLHLDQNQLTGTIPTELGNLTNLQELYLDQNQLTGTIPTELGNLTNLQKLYLHTNQLTGTIPPELGNLSNLKDLYLGNNQLTGAIPTTLGNLGSLVYLMLSNNQLSGSIPAELGNLTGLNAFRLENNNLTGTIPAELENLSVLTELYLNDNQLIGSIPTALGELSNLVYFKLSANQLTGVIPDELGKLTKLDTLGLNDNKLSGDIPSELGNLSKLAELYLGGNQLSDTIPAELGNLDKLTQLYLDNNQLCGEVPTSFSATNLPALTTLDLGTNYLSVSDANVLTFLNTLTPGWTGGWEGTQTATTSCPVGIPLAPTNFTATPVSQTKIALSWTDNSDNETGFKGTRNGITYTTAANVTTFNDTGLTCGTTYNYSVRATNANGDSAPATATITLACVPNAPSNVVATAVSPTQINISWTDNSDNETGFRGERNGIIFDTTAANVTFYNDIGLTCGTTYIYEVRAINVQSSSTAVTTSASTLACPSTPTTSSPSLPSLPPPPTGGNISGSRNMGGQIFTDDTAIKENTSVSNVVFKGDVENEGFISNSTVAPDTTLSGGTLTGTINNEGTIKDVDFVGIKLDGGTLSGTITNNSQVGGIISNVNLAENTTIIDGKVGGYIKCAIDGVTQNVQLTDGTSIMGCNLVGEIDGSKHGQAKIGEAKIEPDTTLSNVCLTPTVQYDPNTVTLGAGVITPTNFANPTPQDFCITPNQIPLWSNEDVIGVETKAFSTFDAEHVANIPASAVSNIVAAQLAEFTKDGLSGMTSEQFSYLLANSLTSLTTANMAGFSPEVIGQFALTHLNALDTEQFQQMLSQDVSKLFTNFDGDKITPTDIESLVPSDWKVDLETGVLTAPDGAKLTLRALSTPEDLPASVELPPDMVDLNDGFGLGGAGTPMVSGLTDALTAANVGNFTPSQTTEGIFQVESPQMRYSFIPDVDDISKVDSQAEPVGLSIGEGGFYRLTTPDAIQVPFIPAPQNPIALSETIGNGMVIMGNSGDVFMELSDQRRRGKTRQVVIFDPFIEPGIDDSCVEIILGEYDCDEFDDLRSGKRGLRQRVQTRKIKYPDGTAQTIYPTVLSPDTFIKESLKIAGVEKVVFNSNGTFYLLLDGISYIVTPKFELQSRELGIETAEAAVIINQAEGRIRYTIPFAYQNIETRRRGKRGKTREVLIFDPFIEPAPDDMCTEIVPGEIICDFDDFD